LLHHINYLKIKTTFVEMITIFVKLMINLYILDRIYTRRLITMKNENPLSNKVRSGIKKGLSIALKTNANSSGCYVIYQPKAPKNLGKFKKFK